MNKAKWPDLVLDPDLKAANSACSRSCGCYCSSFWPLSWSSLRRYTSCISVGTLCSGSVEPYLARNVRLGRLISGLKIKIRLSQPGLSRVDELMVVIEPRIGQFRHTLLTTIGLRSSEEELVDDGWHMRYSTPGHLRYQIQSGNYSNYQRLLEDDLGNLEH